MPFLKIPDIKINNARPHKIAGGRFLSQYIYDGSVTPDHKSFSKTPPILAKAMNFSRESYSCCIFSEQNTITSS